MADGCCAICGKWSHLRSPRRVVWKPLFRKQRDENIHVCDTCYTLYKPINHNGRRGKERRNGIDRRSTKTE